MAQKLSEISQDNVVVAREVLRLGDRGLRVRSQPVTDPAHSDIQELIDQLMVTAAARSGVGIAAPQVGIRRQLFVVASRPNARYPDAPLMTPTALINPAITATSADTALGWEGCLSVPGWRGQVRRAQQIEVTYLDRQGRAQRRVFSDFVARIIQHEFDHLNGTLFLDRIEHTDHLLSEVDYQARFPVLA
ncbi:MAG: peptide deformylase [Cyanobacteria bacterium J06632_22]